MNIEKNSISFAELKKEILNVIEDNKEEKYISLAKKEDGRSNFAASNLRETVTCESCGGPTCVYSKDGIRQKCGPTKANVKSLQQWIEQGYVCGNNVLIKDYYVQQKLRCGNNVELQFYNPSKDAALGGRLITEDICATYFTVNDIMAKEEIKQKPNVVGKNLLPICRYCFYSKTGISTTGGSND